MLVATLSLTLTACGGDNDEPEIPGGGTPASKFEVHEFTRDKIFEIFPYFISVSGAEYGFCKIRTVCSYDYGTHYNYKIGFDGCYNSYAANVRMAKCINVSSLSQITSIKGVNWIDYPISFYNPLHSVPHTPNYNCFNLEENTGFILEGTYEGRTYYIRIFISSFNRNSAGELIGVNGSFQQFIPN